MVTILTTIQDEANEKLTLRILLQMVGCLERSDINDVYLQTWTDNRLRWVPSMYNNINVLTVPRDTVWNPDIVVYETLSVNTCKHNSNVV